MTAMEQLKERLERVERGIFKHSIYPKPCNQLFDMQEEISNIKELFLNQPFTRISVDMLEDIRYRILECEFNVHIFVSELMYQDTSEHMKRLKEHYQSIQ